MDEALLVGSQIYLKILGERDVSKKYVEWLNDGEINKYLETRHATQTLDSCREYVCQMSEDPNNVLWGMFCRETEVHIGNIKLGPIVAQYNRATIGLMVGDRAYWGKGVATEAIKLVTEYAFSHLKLHRIDAGCYAHNLGSKKAFLKVGYSVEGVLKDHYIFDGEYEDGVLLGITLDSVRTK